MKIIDMINGLIDQEETRQHKELFVIVLNQNAFDRMIREEPSIYTFENHRGAEVKILERSHDDCNCSVTIMDKREYESIIAYRQMICTEPKKSPFTPEEQIVWDKLVEVHNAFLKLPETHGSEVTEWVTTMHNLQSLIGLRALRRDYPETFHSLKS